MITNIESYSEWRKGELECNSPTIVEVGVTAAAAIGLAKLIKAIKDASKAAKMINQDPESWIKNLRSMASDLRRLDKNPEHKEDIDLTYDMLDEAERQFKENKKLKALTARQLGADIKWLSKEIAKYDQKLADQWAQKLLPLCQKCENLMKKK